MSAIYSQFIERLLDLAPVSALDLVLDLGTGAAPIPRELVDRSKAGDGIAGLDITPAMLEQAREKCSIGRYAEAVHLVGASNTAVAVSNVRASDEWRAMLLGAGFARIEVREERARRDRYPRVLAINAVAGQAVSGWDAWGLGDRNDVASSWVDQNGESVGSAETGPQ